MRLRSPRGFEYGPNHERVVRKNYPNVYGVIGSATEITHYLGGAEVHRRPTTGVEVKRYVGGVLLVQTAAGVTKNYQWFDHQGSVVAVTDSAGLPMGSDGQMAYDAFGLRRSSFSLTRLFSFNAQATTRHGYTGHEMVDEVGLIHMNGRMYDPLIARFIQGDPMVQDPYNSQSLNRYSYVMNNPLNATDPTGMFSVGGFASMLNVMFQSQHLGGISITCNEGCRMPVRRAPQGSVADAFNNAVMAVPESASNRLGGAGTMVLGGVGIATLAATGCGGVVGCALFAGTAWMSADAIGVGGTTLVTGEPTQSGTNTLFQLAGASPAASKPT
jgi:RHS repeat-associated protein